MFNFIRKIRYWFKYRKQPKLFALRKYLSVEEIKILYPDKLPPLIKAVELLKENHIFESDPEFKFFGYMDKGKKK